MYQHVKLAAALAAVTVGLVLVPACAPPPGPGTTPSSTTSTTAAPATDVTGTVVDSITRVPVAGASVMLTNADGVPIPPSGGSVFSTGTTSEGTFAIGGVPLNFYLLVSAPGFESGLVACPSYRPFQTVEQVFTDACRFGPGSAGTIPLDSFQPHTFGGVVRDSDSLSPVAGAKVVLGTPSGVLSDSEVTFTNNKGEFSFTVAAGLDDLSVYVDGSGVGHQSGYASCLVLPSGDRKVVTTWAESCSYPPVSLGTIGLSPL